MATSFAPVGRGMWLEWFASVKRPDGRCRRVLKLAL